LSAVQKTTVSWENGPFLRKRAIFHAKVSFARSTKSPTSDHPCLPHQPPGTARTPKAILCDGTCPA
jgi:hypothetical protein